MIKIEVVEYQPDWPAKFEANATAIREGLKQKALVIEHIGSTSVAGLAAKPIIDILLVVADSADESSYAHDLVRVGYKLWRREPDFHEHRLFKTSAKDVHLHVFSTTSPEIARYLTFRDRLRANAIDRQQYEQRKRQLATEQWQSSNDYAIAKTEII